MGTEGAGSADSAVRNAIRQGVDSGAADADERECHQHPGRAMRMRFTLPRPRMFLQMPIMRITRRSWWLVVIREQLDRKVRTSSRFMRQGTDKLVSNG